MGALAGVSVARQMESAEPESRVRGALTEQDSRDEPERLAGFLGQAVVAMLAGPLALTTPGIPILWPDQAVAGRLVGAWQGRAAAMLDASVNFPP